MNEIAVSNWVHAGLFIYTLFVCLVFVKICTSIRKDDVHEKELHYDDYEDDKAE